jgi:crossover junction endodeoxyribonuclease RusA
MKITLPYPPTNNHFYAVVRGRKIISAEGRAYKLAVGMVCLSKRIKPIDGDVTVTFRAFRPRKTGDLDNLFKGLFDALKGHVWHDDKQIVEIHAHRADDKDNPRVEVDVTVCRDVDCTKDRR